MRGDQPSRSSACSAGKASASTSAPHHAARPATRDHRQATAASTGGLSSEFVPSRRAVTRGSSWRWPLRSPGYVPIGRSAEPHVNTSPRWGERPQLPRTRRAGRMIGVSAETLCEEFHKPVFAETLPSLLGTHERPLAPPTASIYRAGGVRHGVARLMMARTRRTSVRGWRPAGCSSPLAR
jgi:hypothetical protein